MLKGKESHILIGILVIVASCAVWMNSDNTNLSSRILQKTNSTRTSSVITTCEGKNRNSLISSGAQTQNNQYRAQFRTQFPIDSVYIMKQLVAGNNSDALTEIRKASTNYGIFVVPFVLGLILTIWLTPYLCCCCCCTTCCPSKCCQKDQNEQYTKCQLYWPAITLLLALLLACIASIVGFTKANGLSNGVGNILCSGSILFDDFMNGNQTISNTSFFLGLTTLKTKLGDLSTNINNISSQLQSVNAANMTNFQTQLDSALTKISQIPTGTANQTLSLSYSTPFTGTVTSSVNSEFIGVLGSPATTSSIVGGAYEAIKTVKTSVTTISTNADSFSGSVGSFSSSVSGVTTTIGDFITQLKSVDTTLTDISNSSKSGLSLTTLAIMVFFGVTIGLSTLGILGLMLMCCCEKYKCRYLIYFSCCVLIFIAIIGFFLSFFFSAFLPPLFFVCEALDYSILTAANFNEVFGAKLNANTSDYFTVCLPNSTGDIVSKIAGNISVTLNSLTTSVNTLNTFNTSSLSASITTSFNLIGTKIDDFQFNKITDLPSSATTQYAQLNKLARASNYGCTNVNFAFDSWVPSTAQSPQYVSCTISGGTAQTSCTTPDFTGTACRGCLDTYQLFVAGSATNAATARTFIKTRYTEASCDAFADQISDTWGRFYQIKRASLTSVKSRFTTASTDVTAVTTNLTGTITTTFNNVLTQLSTISDSITNPTTGLIKGLNCLLIGEDLQRFIQVTCLQMFNNLYFLRLVLGIASFGILFSMCCTVCSGVRHFKHSERKDRGLSPFGQPNPNLPYSNDGGTIGNFKS